MADNTTKKSYPTITCSCGESLEVHPMSTPAGWFVGNFCPNFDGGCGGPDRMSGYFRTEAEVEALIDMEWRS